MLKVLRWNFVLLALTASCKKDPPLDIEEPCEPIITVNHSFDTIFPSDYLMAYPGSWWEYDNGLIDSCLSWTPVVIRSTVDSNGCLLVEEDMWILPTGLNYFGAIAFDQSIYNQDDLTSTRFFPILDTIIGVFYQSKEDGGEGNYSNTANISAETVARYDSLAIGANTYYDVLHVKKINHTVYHHLNTGPVYDNQFWFARNVGMIKWTREINGMWNSGGELVDYYIAPY